MNRTISFFKQLLILVAMVSLAGCKTFTQEAKTVPNDPLGAHIYKLDNGLTVFLSVNKESPRIQTYVGVRVGGKNDPAETTGLAHYFEHIMFKGTKQFGTSDYAKEEPLLDEIEQLFEEHRMCDDPEQKKLIYQKIDSVSYLASQYAIPNEYDKLMAAIGASGTNAYTSNDVTVYQENIPSNQIENWARIQADRFANPVIRGFHTELETVYEEKNMSLTQDSRKLFEALLSGLFPDHPYGTQTVLGTQENLKNPSITNIKAYHKKFYVPNNMVISMSGDLDPDQTIAIIKKYFGELKPNPEVDTSIIPEIKPLNGVTVKEVYGIESPMVAIGWRLPGGHSEESDIIPLVSSILSNGKTGLLDQNIMLPQKALAVDASDVGLSDYDPFMMMGLPKEGQTLEELEALLMDQIKLLKAGQFDESLMTATINNYKLDYMKSLERNSSRAHMMMNSFMNNFPWERQVNLIDRLSKYTKQDIVDFANKYFTDNYTVVYKRQGEDKSVVTMEKPQITPIVMNRDNTSEFFKSIVANEPAPITPRFPDFQKELDFYQAEDGREIIYKKNETNEIFTLNYVFEPAYYGEDNYFSYAKQYLDYLGTDQYTAFEIKQKLYELACNWYIGNSGNRVSIQIEGLQENMPEAMDLVEHILRNAQPEPAVLEGMKADFLTMRANNKLSQRANFSALARYVTYGEEYVKKHTLTDQQIKGMTSEMLLERIHNLLDCPHRVIYYGPASKEEVAETLVAHHHVPENQIEAPAYEYDAIPVATPKSMVFIAPYKANNFYLRMLYNSGIAYNNDMLSPVTMYNEYFGSGMNSIVFQEMRESRGLAYSAYAGYNVPNHLEVPYTLNAIIASQNDKLREGINTFLQIINDMPISENAFDIAKNGLMTRLSTYSLAPRAYAFTYLNLKDMNLDQVQDATLYKEIPSMTLDDVKKFQEEYIKDNIYYYMILGDESQLDMNFLKGIGEVKKLTTNQIFGY